jgi:hypothetical protein
MATGWWRRGQWRLTVRHIWTCSGRIVLSLDEWYLDFVYKAGEKIFFKLKTVQVLMKPKLDC